MRLEFAGAAREVTGSCHLIETGGRRILIDCGMQQGADRKNDQSFPFDPRSIDYAIMTHAHIDHSGRLPLLVKQGFSGDIFATEASRDLLSIMLRDSAHIQESEAEWANRKSKRAGKDLVEPLYNINDAEQTVKLIKGFQYDQMIDVCEGVSLRFADAGHLLGSASAEIWLSENGVKKKIVFSGDIGNLNQPIVSDPEYISEADYVVMESTYGDRDHEKAEGDQISAMAEIIERTLKRGGNVIIPSFAVGRTQELLYFIREIKRKHLVKLPDFPVYVDSPLSAEAIRVFEENLRDFSDEETLAVIKDGIDPLRFSNLHITSTSDESKALNLDEEPKVIISSSGMCEAGRIRHHLKHNLWREECSVVFVGYQAGGTLGRAILDGAKKVKLFGEEITIKAEIINFRGLSGHADLTGLLKWIGFFKKKPDMVFAVHGEEEVCESFAALLSQKGYNATAPKWQAAYDLAEGRWLSEGVSIPERAESRESVSPAFTKLLAAAGRLAGVINQKSGYSNKDIASFTSQIEALISKWE